MSIAPCGRLVEEQKVNCGTAPASSIAQVDGLVIHRLIMQGDTVVDVSGDGAEWLTRVVTTIANIRALLYASPEAEGSALGSMSGAGRSRGVALTQGTDLDADTRSEGIRQIHFLHIGHASSVQSVLNGAAGLLSHSRINYVQFPWNTHDLWTAQVVNRMLVANNYRLFAIETNELGDVSLQPFASWSTGPGRQNISLLAAHERFMFTLTGSSNYSISPWSWAMSTKHGIKFRGVIHLGANEGVEELQIVRRLAIPTCLLVEANPSVFERLERNCQGIPGVTAVNKAILDRSGPVSFHLTNYEMSDSILNLGTHSELYPTIAEKGVIQVEGTTLDALLREKNLDPALFNILSLDIQGAELLALRGARDALKHVDLVFTEISFENLYEGCGQVDEVDDYLAQFAFRRVFTFTVECPAWGDAVYAKLALPVPSLPGIPPFL